MPSTNTTVEPEFAAFLPPDVAVFSTRVAVAEVATEEEKVASLLAMHSQLDRAVAELASAGVSAIAYACTSGSFLGGRDSDQATCDRLTRTYGVPIVTTSSALVTALSTLDVKKVALATPYVRPVAEGAVTYLGQAGFSVTARNDLEILSNLDKGRLEPAASFVAATDLDVSDADAVAISCTNWRTLESLVAIERETGKPAVSSNLATLWALLRLAGIDEPLSPSVRLSGLPLPDSARAEWHGELAEGGE
ncbi:maleate cis-trans isomerase family protein [Lentzea fradiae]|uniref:maleate cis-trans isomerase family protein n=1 Tax=Lentzea fradiae TaxID=200378 RepID=UPI0015A2E271|nr:aspartate/glutamate racemase family protein [Lentzea fradiae]